MVDDTGDSTMKILQDQRRIKIAIIISLVNLVIILAYGFVSWKSWENIQLSLIHI